VSCCGHLPAGSWPVFRVVARSAEPPPPKAVQSHVSRAMLSLQLPGTGGREAACPRRKSQRGRKQPTRSEKEEGTRKTVGSDGFSDRRDSMIEVNADPSPLPPGPSFQSLTNARKRFAMATREKQIRFKVSGETDVTSSGLFASDKAFVLFLLR
jgi:hypothetical protein